MSSLPQEADYGGSTNKAPAKLSTKQREDMVERLYEREMVRINKRNKAFEQELDFMTFHNDVTKKRLKKELSEEEAVIVKNCYDNQLALLEKKKETKALKDSAEVEKQRRVLADDELDGMVTRLYNQSMDRKKMSMAASKARQEKSEAEKRPPVIKKSKADLEAGIAHLYTESIKKKQESDAKLDDQYAWKKVKCKKLTQEEIAEGATRLATKTA
eukprot:TRINITY_DN18890_c0_g1_i1.p1 TRINITY_DN18890_c0_g1~~TRINITY_DN18890_c0_g1_i1.p1  ORF type:complete len:215 (+),score=93.70 TRINITY_DN18890_c0_g1_i1:230-874(+)